MGNYKPFSILNCFSKVQERSLHKLTTSFSNKFSSDFISAYRKACSRNVLIRLIENWKTTLDRNLFAGAILMYLPKAFELIPHDLLITKLHADGLSFGTATLLNWYFED